MRATEEARPGLVSSATLTLVARIAAFFFSLVTNVILARALGPDGRGVYAVAVLIPGLIALATQFGIAPANVYHLSKGLVDFDDLIGHSLSIGLLLGVVCVAFVAGYVEFTHARSFAGIPSQYVVVSSLSLPFALITAFLQGVLTGAQRFLRYNVSVLTQYGSQTVVLAAVVLVRPASTMAAVVAWLASAAISALVTAICAASLGRMSLRLHIPTVRRLLRFGLISYLGSVTSFVNYRFDVLLVNLFAGARAVGLYAVGTGLAEIVWYVASAAGVVLAPRIAATASDEGDRVTEAVCRVVTGLALVGGLALATLAPLLIPVFFGAAFAESVWAVWLLLPGIVTFSVARILSMYLLGRNRLKVDLAASFVGLVLTRVLDLALIPRFGSRGAAIASSIAYTATMVVDFVWVTTHSSITAKRLLIPRVGDARLLVRRIGEALSLQARVSVGR